MREDSTIMSRLFGVLGLSGVPREIPRPGRGMTGCWGLGATMHQATPHQETVKQRPINQDGETGQPDRRALLKRALAACVLAGVTIPPRAADAQGADPRQPIVDLNAALQAGMRQGAAPFQQRFDRLAPVIDRVFDLDAILRSSAGLRWTSLNEAAQRSIFSIFRTFTIASHVSNFDQDNGEKFEVLPQLRASGNDQIVQSVLMTPKGERIKIDYVMRAGAGGWRVVDVLLDGSISRVAVQRSDFRALLTSGDPAPLIDSLRRKVAELSGGAMRP